MFVCVSVCVLAGLVYSILATAPPPYLSGTIRVLFTVLPYSKSGVEAARAIYAMILCFNFKP